MQTARTEPPKPVEHPQPWGSWVHSMIHGSAGLSASQVGGKAWNLARLADAGALVPPWVVIPAWVFDRFAAAAVSSRGGAADCASALQILQETPLPARLTTAVLAALDTAGVHGEVAVRSSAVEEDGARASFAGQFDSMLGVHLIDEAEALWAAIRQVWASAYGHRAAAYRLHQGAPLQGPSGMGVVVQQLVSPSVSGVAFTADPVTGDPDVVVVSSVFGLGDGLVSGELDADTFRVRFRGDRPVLVERTIATKERAVRSVSGGGTALLPLAIELRNRPSLRDEQALDVAREARRLADAMGSPQDVEWALLPPIGGGRTGGAFVALQARPITTPVSSAHLTSREPSSQPPPRPGSATRLWENSNLIESYGGMTSPMTFSFARRVYEGVYREFARTMGVPRALLQTNRPVFASMLGYVRGRVYYNLFNWYRTLRLLPAYSLNREFLDGMLGVDDSTLEPPRCPPRSPPRGGASRDRHTWPYGSSPRHPRHTDPALSPTGAIGSVSPLRRQPGPPRAGPARGALPEARGGAAHSVADADRQRLLRHDLLRDSLPPGEEVASRRARHVPERSFGRPGWDSLGRGRAGVRGPC